jgi:hypothetical protein
VKVKESESWYVRDVMLSRFSSNAKRVMFSHGSSVSRSPRSRGFTAAIIVEGGGVLDFSASALGHENLPPRAAQYLYKNI